MTIRIVIGDEATVEMTPHDLGKGPQQMILATRIFQLVTSTCPPVSRASPQKMRCWPQRAELP
jgi:hypothetical protein